MILNPKLAVGLTCNEQNCIQKGNIQASAAKNNMGRLLLLYCGLSVIFLRKYMYFQLWSAQTLHQEDWVSKAKMTRGILELVPDFMSMPPKRNGQNTRCMNMSLVNCQKLSKMSISWTENWPVNMQLPDTLWEGTVHWSVLWRIQGNMCQLLHSHQFQLQWNVHGVTNASRIIWDPTNQNGNNMMPQF